MAKFKDLTGQEWTPFFNVTLAREIRQTLEIDLLTLNGSGAAFHRMETDRELLAKVLWVTCCDAAQHAGLDEAEFCRRLAGGVFNDAVKAVRASVVEFLMVPEHQLRDANTPRKGPLPGVTAREPAEFKMGGVRSDFSTHPEDQHGHISG